MCTQAHAYNTGAQETKRPKKDNDFMQQVKKRTYIMMFFDYIILYSRIGSANAQKNCNKSLIF